MTGEVGEVGENGKEREPAPLGGNSYMTFPGAARDVEESAYRNAERSGKAQLVHYHRFGEGCNDSCHRVEPDGLWPGGLAGRPKNRED